MILRNYYGAYVNGIFGYTPSKISEYRVRSIGGTECSSLDGVGYEQKVYAPTLYYCLGTKFDTSGGAFAEKAKNAYSAGLIFGSGNTAPTVNDITLAGNPIDSSKITYTVQRTTVSGDDKFIMSALFTITNVGNEAITIGEIALAGYFNYKVSQYGDTYYYPYLIERSALEVPITIEPGGVGQVTYTITMNYPTA